MTIRVVLADDHELFREGLVMVLGAASGIDVVADVGGGEAAIEAARSLVPDVAVVDVAMPEVNGVEVIAHLRDELPTVRTICLSGFGDRDIVGRALSAGAAGYIVKGCRSGELIEAIRSVAAGASYLCAAVTQGVIRDAVDGAGDDPPHPLTEREREVLQLIAEGHRSGDIARRLSISQKTVGTHREHIMAKLDIRSIALLTKYAIRHGYTSAV